MKPTGLLKFYLLIIVVSAFVSSCNEDVSTPSYLDKYNIVWTTPSANSSGSMPLGGGDIGVNVWVEKGDLLFYAQQNAASKDFPDISPQLFHLQDYTFASTIIAQLLSGLEPKVGLPFHKAVQTLLPDFSSLSFSPKDRVHVPDE